MQNRNFNFKRLTQVINAGGVIAYPTESVYGFGCDPLNKVAVNRILKIKQRSVNKGLIIIATDIKQIKPWVQNIPVNIWEKVVNSYATNWVLPKSDLVPYWVSGDHQTVVIRISQHQIVRDICKYLGQPIISTSVNVAGRIELSNFIKVRKQFGKHLDFIVHGKVGGLAPCSIIDPLNNVVLR